MLRKLHYQLGNIRIYNGCEMQLENFITILHTRETVNLYAVGVL